MRTHEGNTRFVKLDYIARHRAQEGQAPGFTYGVAKRWVTFEEIFLGGPRRLFARTRQGPVYKYDGLSTKICNFFEALHKEDTRERDRRRREVVACYDTITINAIPGYNGRHRLREDNQWPTHPQNLLVEASH